MEISSQNVAYTRTCRNITSSVKSSQADTSCETPDDTPLDPCAPHPWLSPEGAPKRESVVWRFFLTDIHKITQMVLHTVQYLSTRGTLPSIKSFPVKLHILHFVTMCVLN